MLLGRAQDRLNQTSGSFGQWQRSDAIKTTYPRGRICSEAFLATDHLFCRKPLWLRWFNWSKEGNVFVIFRQQLLQVFELYDDPRLRECVLVLLSESV